MVGHEDPEATQRKGLSASIATTAAEVLILIFFSPEKGVWWGLEWVVTAQVPRPLQSRAGGSCGEAGRTSCGKEGLARALGS